MRRSAARTIDATQFCRDILPAVSRTFALGIRLLPGDLGAAVRTAYLLCRIADTIEDEPDTPAERKAARLSTLARCFDDAALLPTLALDLRDLRGDAAHRRLAANSDLVFRTFGELPPATRAVVRRWVLEMIGGMRKFVLAYPAGMRIQSVDEYHEYCYYVAGTVGHLLTDLWYEHAPSIGATEYEMLRARCRAFAEALQTVNILKDVARDAEHENSIYIPEQLLRSHGSAHAELLGRGIEGTRSAIAALTQLAHQDLELATSYLLAIPRRAVAIRLFCALPLLFAYATLRDLARAPEALSRRETVKISRAEVKSLTLLSMLGAMSNFAMRRLVARARRKPVVLGF
jgi:farnesyl-diphosphate farnesyltransferase